jgi:hypothetical protein
VSNRTTLAACGVVLAGLILAACDDVSMPSQAADPLNGMLTIRVESVGTNFDPDGYVLSWTGHSERVAANDTVTVEMRQGWREFTLSELSMNCRLPLVPVQSLFGWPPPDEAFTRTDSVYVSQKSDLLFTVFCSETGTLRLLVQTDTVPGSASGPFTVRLSHDPRPSVKAVGWVTFDDVSAGEHIVYAGCFGPPSRKNVVVPAGGVAVDSIRVTLCIP